MWVAPVVMLAICGGGWLGYRRLLQRGHRLLEVRPQPNFSVGNQFEATNIFGPIVFGDEYQLGDCRFEPDDVVVDVGAHIGCFSYLCYSKGSRAIYSYEPRRRNFELLQSNLGSRDGVHLYRAAVWRSDVHTPIELNLSGGFGENTGAGSVIAGGSRIDYATQTIANSTGEPERVTAIRLDDILGRFDSVKLLKLDCEASEFPILFTSRLLHKVEIIVAEIHEVSSEGMALLNPESRVPGYDEYRLQTLVPALEAQGFEVATRNGQGHMHGIVARRRPTEVLGCSTSE